MSKVTLGPLRSAPIGSISIKLGCSGPTSWIRMDKEETNKITRISSAQYERVNNLMIASMTQIETDVIIYFQNLINAFGGHSWSPSQ